MYICHSYTDTVTCTLIHRYSIILDIVTITWILDTVISWDSITVIWTLLFHILILSSHGHFSTLDIIISWRHLLHWTLLPHVLAPPITRIHYICISYTWITVTWVLYTVMTCTYHMNLFVYKLWLFLYSCCMDCYSCYVAYSYMHTPISLFHDYYMLVSCNPNIDMIFLLLNM